jgi:hypothetical protein
MKKMRHNDLQREKKPKQREGRVLVGVVVLTTALVLFGRCPGEVEPIQKECPPCVSTVERKQPVKKVKHVKQPKKTPKKVVIVKDKPPEKRTLGPCPSDIAKEQQGNVETQVKACRGEIRKVMENEEDTLLVLLNGVFDMAGGLKPAKNPGVAVPLYDGKPSEDADEKLNLQKVMYCLMKTLRSVRTTKRIEEPGCKQGFRVIIPAED